jgi:phosphate transport system permease protein
VFGLGFFCYFVGGHIDQVFFRASLAQGNDPTFGTGGLLWASLTLAILTLPVVIVATEEALSAVPNSMREGSFACGASKWQTIRRIVLPRALPGIMTGVILAMARGVGEVAPLMLVGVAAVAKQLPVDGVFPYLHAQRKFLHLGFQIYDVGFQSPNSEAAKPMVYTLTLLLVLIVACLNIGAIWLRKRLRQKFLTAQF